MGELYEQRDYLWKSLRYNKKVCRKFSEMTKIPVADYKEIKNLSEYDLIIHYGGLYAGGVKGLKETLNKSR
ncbi:MAG: hypothetical protein ACI4HK_01490 [Ruminococcus sp.]